MFPVRWTETNSQGINRSNEEVGILAGLLRQRGFQTMKNDDLKKNKWKNAPNRKKQINYKKSWEIPMKLVFIPLDILLVKFNYQLRTVFSGSFVCHEFYVIFVFPFYQKFYRAAGIGGPHYFLGLVAFIEARLFWDGVLQRDPTARVFALAFCIPFCVWFGW